MQVAVRDNAPGANGWTVTTISGAARAVLVLNSMPADPPATAGMDSGQRARARRGHEAMAVDAAVLHGVAVEGADGMPAISEGFGGMLPDVPDRMAPRGAVAAWAPDLDTGTGHAAADIALGLMLLDAPGIARAAGSTPRPRYVPARIPPEQ